MRISKFQLVQWLIAVVTAFICLSLAGRQGVPPGSRIYWGYSGLHRTLLLKSFSFRLYEPIATLIVSIN